MKKNKKYFVFYYIVIILLSLISCDDGQLEYIEKNNQKNISDTPFEYIKFDDEPLDYYNLVVGWDQLQYINGYIYFRNGLANPFNFPENQTLWRYNVETNNITTVCPDPLCKHNTKDCPIFAISDNFYI